MRAEGEQAATHAFAAPCPATSAGTGRSPWCGPRAATRRVAEVVLLPGEGALLAPEWVPWSERLQPGDLSPGDLLPTAPDDPRLVPGYLLIRRPAGRGGRLRTRPRPGPGAVAARPAGGGRTLAGRRLRPGQPRWPSRPRRTAAPAGSSCPGRFAAGRLRRLRQRDRRRRRPGGRRSSTAAARIPRRPPSRRPSELGEVYEDELFDIEPDRRRVRRRQPIERGVSRASRASSASSSWSRARPAPSSRSTATTPRDAGQR